jgi:hypothetical protein
MKTLLLILFFAAQSVTPPATGPDRPWDGKDHGEGALPEGHYCQNHPLTEKQKKQGLANECHCDYMCVAEDSEWYPYYPTSDCLAFCHKANVQCTCHPEEPCPHPGKEPDERAVNPAGLSHKEFMDAMAQKHDELKHHGQPFK